MKFNSKNSGFEAMSQAQMIAFYPMAFQAVISVKRLGILEFIDKKNEPQSVADIAESLSISEYGVMVLLDMCSVMDVVSRCDNNTFELGNVGYFLLHDKQTSVNLDFTNDVCYKGLFHLTESIQEKRPIGLKEIGDWPTIYEGLIECPSHIKNSWFNFDHFYSDAIFNNVMSYIFRSNPKRILDIGGNTGKFTIAACDYNNDVQLAMVDLKKQLIQAESNIIEKGHQNRVKFIQQDMLASKVTLPKDQDVIWMSQFLDCFSEQEIEKILNSVAKFSNKDTRVLILETFWDTQKFKSAEYCLHATSLYFTAIANGNSRMYAKESFENIIDKTDLSVCEVTTIGEYHTLLELKI